MMEEKTARRVPFLPVLIFMSTILLHQSYCGVAISLNSNATSSLGGPVVDMDESEFKFDSEISRMLIDYKHITDSSRERGRTVCSRQSYKACLPQNNGKRGGETCDPYKRVGC